MRKIIYCLLLMVMLVSLSACTQEESKKKEAVFNPANPGEYAGNMLNLKEEAQKDVEKATEQENGKNNNSLNENNMENNTSVVPQALPDNSALVVKFKSAVIKTNLGKIKVKFYGEDSPITVGNFLKLSQDGFYNGTKFHRVIKNFMIQGGDPLSKDDAQKSRWGTGGPGYKFQDEFNSHKLVKGSLAMANSGANTNGSQFFIVTADATAWLDGKHTNFGEVIEGMEIVEKIEKTETGESDRPAEDVIIEGVELLEK